ncbi:hypothetical protein ACNOYE_40015 [Nannocystaceae bacterium ST9]
MQNADEPVEPADDPEGRAPADDDDEDDEDEDTDEDADDPEAEPSVGSDEGEADTLDEDSDFGPPFESRSFGGEFVWADAEAYTCKILRVRAGEKVLVSTRGRRDMVVMLTGGRAVLEVIEGEGIDRVEMLPAAPIAVHPDREHRLVALTEVEMFTVYTRLDVN